MSAGRTASNPARQRDRAAQRQALEYLISSEWLIGESASRGLAPSQQEVRQQIARRKTASFPGGETEFNEFLAMTHLGIADVEFEAKVELASSKLRQLAVGTASKVTGAQVAAYYKRHRRMFVIPETRVTEFANRKTKAEAEKLKREVESGKDLVSATRKAVGEVTMTVSSPPNNRNLMEKAVYAAKLNVVTNLVHKGADYDLYRVVKIFPSSVRPLAQVEGTIKSRLADEAQRRALAAFIRAWRAKWMARTNCGSEYLVQKCRQYSGSRALEDPLNLN